MKMKSLSEESNPTIELDKTDIDIIKALSRDSRLSVRELASQVHRSSTPVFERLKRLEREGVIKAYTVLVDQEKIGRAFTVFCNVKLSHINTEIHDEFARKVAAMAEVTECYNVSGSFDYLLKVQVPDMKAYRSFVTDTLGCLPMVDSVQSVFAMDTIKMQPSIV